MLHRWYVLTECCASVMWVANSLSLVRAALNVREPLLVWLRCAECREVHTFEDHHPRLMLLHSTNDIAR
jgi:hypothetical protein